MPFVVTDGQITSAAATSPLEARTGISLAGLGVSYLERTVAYDAIYRSQPAVRSVVDFLAKNVAALKVELYQGDDAERVRLRDHPLGRLVRRPLADRRSRFAFYRALVSDLAIYDAHVSAKVPLAGGGLGLLRIPPIHLKRIGGGYFAPEGFAITDGLGRTIRELPLAQVVYARGYNPSSEATGVAPMETLRQVIAEELASVEYRRALWRNGARVSGIIERPVEAPAWSDTARERFLEEWAAFWTGSSETAGGTPVLEEGMSYNAVTMTAVEAEYLGARRLNREEVDSVYHVPGVLLGTEGGGSNGGAADTAARRGMYADVLGPLTSQIADELGVNLIPDFPDLDPEDTFLEFNLEAKLRGHFAEQAEVISRSVGGPWLTRDEARGMFNRPPLPNGQGEQIITPLNVTVGGRANPADTAPGTPGLGQATRVIDVLEVPGKAKGTPGGELPAIIRPWVAKHVDELGAVVEDARRSTVSKIGAGQSAAKAFDRARWRKALAKAALGVGVAMVEEEAKRTMRELDVSAEDYDPALTTPWLEVNADATAATITDRLADVVANAVESAKSLKADDPDPVIVTPAKAVDDAFATFLDGMLLVYAATRVTGLASFARTDVAEKAGRPSKTWRTNSSDPRSSHASLNGVTIPMGDRFANGALWPGDPALSADERANCTCTIDF
jgi:HK97 family phage portal protein